MKAILVMEMPGNCLECPLLNGSDECTVQNEDANCFADTLSELRNECPLVPMPERKMELKKKTYFMGEYAQSIYVPVPENEGWNACLDAIERIKK